MQNDKWYSVAQSETLVSPALLVYPERVSYNIDQMIDMIGDVNRLRPHIKTHKTAEIIKMQMNKGISKFKCATIAEAELLGICSAPDILLALQPVAFNIERLFQLIKKYPLSKFTTIADNEGSIRELSLKAQEHEQNLGVYLDLNTGMDRTGIIPDEMAANLYRLIASLPFLEAAGLHAYDGHIRQPDIVERKKVCDEAFKLVEGLKKQIEGAGIEVPNIVAGGSPSFPIHAKRSGVEASPGTTLLWDARYGSLFREMPFVPAAALFTRVISKPASDLVCTDLGHKALAPEMPFPRVEFLELDDCEQISQSEEHLVLQYKNPEKIKVGKGYYAIPMHICPTVAKYPRLITISEGKVTGSWEVAARDHQLNL